MKILIVEDEQRARKGLRNVLLSLAEPEDEIVGEASDGQNALEQIQCLKPDVVFTDIQMPYMDGIALIRNTRARDIKVDFVIISAYADFKRAQQAISLGVVEYLLKPVNSSDVEKVLGRLRKSQAKNAYDWKKTQSLRDEYENVHPLILDVLDFIENSYSGKISQKELAKSLGISSEYLSYLFKKEIGESFAKFIQGYRVKMAKQLLCNPEVNTAEIAYLVGFTDSKYFYQVFKEIEGVSVKTFLRENT